MPFSYGSRQGHSVEWIIIHYPAAPGCSAKWCWEYYNKPNVTESAHFAIDQSHIESLVPCNLAAFHCAVKGKTVYCNATNLNSIGIDIMDRKLSTKTRSVSDHDWYIPEQTLTLAADFIARLMQIYDIDINHVIRHYDVTHKACPRPLVGDDFNEFYKVCGNARWIHFKQQILEKLNMGVCKQ
jgi:N-acetylmuramoyl-L-alanine amidase CwlA